MIIPDEAVLASYVPPCDVDAEQSVLGAVFIDGKSIHSISGLLSPADFYRDAHAILYESFLSLSANGHPIDSITVADELRRRQSLEVAGGTSYIVALLDAVPTAANIEHYAKIVKEKSRLRFAIERAQEIISYARDPAAEADEALARIEGIALNMQDTGSRSYQSYGEGLVAAFERSEINFENKGRAFGIPTGYPDLDAIVGGFGKKQLVVVASRPGMGKSAFALNIASNMAKEGARVGFWTLEMSSDEVFDRAAVLETSIFPQRLWKGDMSDQEWARYDEAVRYAAEVPIYVSDSEYLSPRKLRSEALRQRSEVGLDIIFVDYFQLMEWQGRAENETVRLGNISRALKNLASELNVPIVLISQLNRDLEKRQDKRPQLSDLRGTGALEQDANKVLFPYRESYYSNSDQADDGVPDVTEIIVAKHRGGRRGTARLEWRGIYMQFRNENGMGALGEPTPI